MHDGPFTLVADARLDNREEALAAELGVDAGDLAEMPESALLMRAWRHWGEAAPSTSSAISCSRSGTPTRAP